MFHACFELKQLLLQEFVLIRNHRRLYVPTPLHHHHLLAPISVQ
jgi:hypothetical protein